MIFEDTRNATSSPVADSGQSQPASPDGPTTANSGQAPARASRSRKQGRDSEPMTQGICGRTFIGSSVPDGPLSLWESRLRERLGEIGSTECALIWRLADMPDGQSISRLARSTRHTNGTGSGGSLWPTPKASTAGESSRSGDRKDEPLMGGLMRMATWPTPTHHDFTDSNPERLLARRERIKAKGINGNGFGLTTGNMMALAMWRSPTAGENRGGSYSDPEKAIARIHSGHTINLEDQMVAGGPTQNGSSATTAKRGAPNPKFPCWLMGWSDEMVSGALRGIQSRQLQRRKSSARTSTSNVFD